jgi:hypothetical protein
VTIDGGDAVTPFTVDRGVTASLSGLTISHGRVPLSFPLGNGAGIENEGTLTLTSCTLFGNHAGFQGGGIDNSGGTALLHNSIVAGDFHDFMGIQADDISGPVGPGSSYNLIGTGGSGGLSSGVNHNLVGVSDPGLADLADNGGPTQTMAVLPTSPALGAGDPALVGTTDQRGFVRMGLVNIGAYQGPAIGPGSGASGAFYGYPPWDPWNPGNPGTPHVQRMM